MEPLEQALISFLSTLLDLPVDEELRTLLGHKIKQAGLGIPNPTKFAEVAHDISKRTCRQIVSSLRHNYDLNIQEHADCVKVTRCMASVDCWALE